MRRSRRTAFTIVELLVVIAILGILMALLIPAVMAAREAARQTQCKNHLKQLATAMLLHEEAQGFFPSGGWGWLWVGDADRGSGREQPGSWVFGILPFLEHDAVYEMGRDGDPEKWTPEQLDGSARRLMTPLAVYQCPSRRSAEVYPISQEDLGKPYGSAQVTANARTDYAACAGDQETPEQPGPESLKEARTWTKMRTWPKPETSPTGVAYARSEVSLGMIPDGTTSTYMLGEKYMDATAYANGQDWGDNESMYTGYNNDAHRSTYYDAEKGMDHGPARDEAGVLRIFSFGSAHPGGFNMAMCDGSVQTVNYSISLEVHRGLGNRNDGLPFSTAGAF